jgi:hypothetical protein
MIDPAIAHYRITGKIDQSGMGEVYQVLKHEDVEIAGWYLKEVVAQLTYRGIDI